MRLRVLVVSLLLLILVSLPYLFAIQAGGNEYVFGGFLFNIYDGNSYLAKMQQGWQGDTTFTLPYTAEPGEGSYLFLFYIFLGHLARWLGWPVILLFHMARLASTVLLLISIYLFLNSNLPDRRALGFTFALIVLGSGLGWLAANSWLIYVRFLGC